MSEKSQFLLCSNMAVLSNYFHQDRRE